MNKNCQKNNRRYYQVGGLTIQVDSDLPITGHTFAAKFEDFHMLQKDAAATTKQNRDIVTIHHHFTLPELKNRDIGKEFYRKAPWAIYREGKSWIYQCISDVGRNDSPHLIATFNRDHSCGNIFHHDEKIFRKGNLHTLTTLPTDQIQLSRVLANRNGCYFHSSGAIINNQGFLFTGQSGAGKSTLSRMLEKEAEVLCDDRNIVRHHEKGFQIYGTWSHGQWPVVSASSAPLRAIIFLEQASENRLIPVTERRESIHKLLARLIKPLETADWWQKMFTLLEEIVKEVPCYTLRFDKSGNVIKIIRQLANE